MDAAVVLGVVSLLVTTAVAIVLGVRQYRLGANQYGLQQRVAAIEEERRAEEIARKQSADVTVDFPRRTDARGRELVLRNRENAAPAENVALSFRAAGEGGLPIIHLEAGFLPVPRMDPGQEYRFPSVVTGGSAPAFDVTITWVDEQGSKEKTVRLKVH